MMRGPNGELVIVFDDETESWKIKEEPYAVIECPTEEDYEHFKEMVDFYKKHHECEDKSHEREEGDQDD